MTRFLNGLVRLPIIQAPLGGGPGTAELTAAVSETGALGFVAAAYKTPSEMEKEIARVRKLTSKPFGVNVFVPRNPAVDEVALSSYLSEIRPEAQRLGANIGEPLWDDDFWAAKTERLLQSPCPWSASPLVAHPNGW